MNDEENLTLHQKSLKALFHTPLQLPCWLHMKRGPRCQRAAYCKDRDKRGGSINFRKNVLTNIDSFREELDLVGI